MPSLFSGCRGGTHPLAVGPVKPRPLPRPGRSDRQRRRVPQKPGPGRQIVSKDNPSGVSRIGGQAGTQAPDPTPVPPQNRGGRAGSTYPQSPCRIGAATISIDLAISNARIIYSVCRQRRREQSVHHSPRGTKRFACNDADSTINSTRTHVACSPSQSTVPDSRDAQCKQGVRGLSSLSSTVAVPLLHY